MIVSASSADWRCWASKSDGTYLATITGVIGNTFRSRTAPPDALASDTAVSIADLARSVSARSTGTKIFLNIVAPLVRRGHRPPQITSEEHPSQLPSHLNPLSP